MGGGLVTALPGLGFLLSSRVVQEYKPRVAATCGHSPLGLAMALPIRGPGVRWAGGGSSCSVSWLHSLLTTLLPPVSSVPGLCSIRLLPPWSSQSLPTKLCRAAG